MERFDDGTWCTHCTHNQNRHIQQPIYIANGEVFLSFHHLSISTISYCHLERKCRWTNTHGEIGRERRRTRKKKGEKKNGLQSSFCVTLNKCQWYMSSWPKFESTTHSFDCKDCNNNRCFGKCLMCFRFPQLILFVHVPRNVTTLRNRWMNEFL